MSIAIPTEFSPFINDLISTGAFPTEEAVICEALRRLRDDRAKFDELKVSFDEAIEELDRTGGTPLDFNEIRRKARALAAARQ